ncbi:MAG: glycosyltransferase [Clostridiaceae bacterium]|jgi:glycosyltransferase involved in cell wall biosynthesis|nr:glycosyltransferase [Clostridiaceae bacterium]
MIDTESELCFFDRPKEGRARITVIIPFYNEEDQVLLTLDTTRSILNTTGEQCEIFAIDDGSSDRTWHALCEYERQNSGFSAVRFSRNFGKEAAICAGLAYAKGDAAIVMDGDLQHPPKYIPLMIRLWREGYDVVEGVKSSRGRESIFSRAAANCFYRIFHKMSGIQLENASDFKLLDRKVIDAWNSCPEKETFFRALSAWLGFSRKTFEFDVEDRTRGRSKWGFKKLVRLSVNAITGFSSRPLVLITWIGMLFLVFFFALGIQTLVRYFSGRAASGFTTVILLQLLIGSLVLISLGLIGLYLASLFHEEKKRPRYIVSDRIGRSGITSDKKPKKML